MVRIYLDHWGLRDDGHADGQAHRLFVYRCSLLPIVVYNGFTFASRVRFVAETQSLNDHTLRI